MRGFIGWWSVVAAVLLAFAQTSEAQVTSSSVSVLVPQSSIQRPEDVGVRSHTNTMLKLVHGSAEQGVQPNVAAGSPPYPYFAFETPASLGCVYRVVSRRVAGCNPNTATINPTGGSRTIAIVDAYDDPNAANDLAQFSNQFGLPAANFEVVYATGSAPAQDPTGGWEGEESLDIEMAHAMAPRAAIVLVEGASNSNADLYNAVTVASGIVSSAGGGEVSMGWGSPEYESEASNDLPFFATPGVVYVASTGDASGTEYPSVSPNVVAAGGSVVRRSFFTGDLRGQGVWQQAGGGPSQYEPRPAFQNAVKSAFSADARGARGVPDLSFDSDPNSGVWVYDSFPMSDAPSGGVEGSNWYIYGGTSVAAPALAGIFNAANHFSASSALELDKIYTHRMYPTQYLDLNSGNCGPYDGFSAAAGWDYCTGVGVPFGYAGK